MKRQDYVFGSTSDNVEEQSTSALNNGWAELSILYSRVLNGVCAALSQSTNTVSQEVANAIAGMGVTLNESDSSQLLKVLQTLAIKASDFQTPITADNKGATMKEIEDVVTSSLTFKGFVATTEPSGNLEEGNLWINASSMPTTIPIASALIKEWNGTSWVAYGSAYTPANFDFFRNNNDNEGYYWFAGQWKVMSTDLSTDYFTLNQTSGKWEIKNSVNLPGTPTVNTPNASNTRAIVNVDFVKNNTISSGNFTNCLTEIPRDIIVTIENDTAVLKSGSKLYRPNGENVFNEVTVPSDKTFTASADGVYMLFLRTDNTIWGTLETSVSSGTALPTGTATFYNTTDNTIDYYVNGAKNARTYTLPFATVTVANGKVTKINSTFNGFGYIGSTLFSLPGVRGLAPNGRDSSERLANTSITSTSVKTRTYTTAYNAVLVMDTYAQPLAYGAAFYNAERNYVYTDAAYTNRVNVAIIGRATLGSGGRITSFDVDPVFHATNYSDLERLTQTVSENDNNAVHKTGGETIAGPKTFTGSVNFQNGTWGDSYRGFIYQLSNGTLALGIRNQDNSEWMSSQQYSINGGWFNQASEYVFTNGLSSSIYGMSILPFSSGGMSFGMKQDTSTWLGRIFFNPDGNINMQPVDGKYVTAPTPLASDNSTKVATTGFLKYVLSSNGNGLATFSKGVNGYYKFSNGLILQWGRLETTGESRTINFPIPFTTTNYFVTATALVTANVWDSFFAFVINDESKTTTNIEIRTDGNTTVKTCVWFAIGY